MDIYLYALPALPLIVRLFVAIRFSGYMGDILPVLALDRTDHRTIIVALAGFSFAGLLGLVALPGNLEERQLPIWYVFVSFISLIAGLNLQSYKARRWHDMLGDSLLESATLALIASVTTFILRSNIAPEFRLASAILASLVWISDFLIRLIFTISNLIAKEKRDGLT